VQEFRRKIEAVGPDDVNRGRSPLSSNSISSRFLENLILVHMPRTTKTFRRYLASRLREALPLDEPTAPRSN
jgi:hypothetical protein